MDGRVDRELLVVTGKSREYEIMNTIGLMLRVINS
jgi:hypothetical protein